MVEYRAAVAAARYSRFLLVFSRVAKNDFRLRMLATQDPVPKVKRARRGGLTRLTRGAAEAAPLEAGVADLAGGAVGVGVALVRGVAEVVGAAAAAVEAVRVGLAG
jgi:hypothetical protein